MSVITAAMKRENLFQEISRTLSQWSEIDRKIFSKAHYEGQSVRSISHSLQLDAKKVKSILKQCELRLHASLRSFRRLSRDKASIVGAENPRLSACEKDLNKIPALGLHASQFFAICRKPA